jgi:hypothetical protein
MIVKHYKGDIIIDNDIYDKIKDEYIISVASELGKLYVNIFKYGLSFGENGIECKKALARYVLNIDSYKNAPYYKDGNYLNCQRSNLEIRRLSDIQRLKYKNNKKYKGVHKNRGGHTYLAWAYNNRIKYYIGSYKTDLEAALKVDAAYRYLKALNIPNIPNKKVRLTKKEKRCIDKFNIPYKERF